MKTKLIRILLWLAVVDFLLGTMLVGYQLLSGDDVNLWRGALILLVVGAWGVVWCVSALRRQAAMVQS
jgi:hypothetical protein